MTETHVDCAFCASGEPMAHNPEPLDTIDIAATVRSAAEALRAIAAETERRGVAGVPGYPFAEELPEIIAKLQAWADSAE